MTIERIVKVGLRIEYELKNYRGAISQSYTTKIFTDKIDYLTFTNREKDKQ